jgi:CheY-like chemotaxis protein
VRITEAIHQRAGGRLVLVVDDNPLNRLVLSEMLELAGFRVIQARDGVEALSMADKRRPDLILMDISMPRMGGREALERLRGDHAGAVTPVVAVSADISTAHREKCEEAGFDGFVGKPVEMEALIETALNLTHCA